MKRRLLDHLRDSKSVSRKDIKKLFKGTDPVEESEVVHRLQESSGCAVKSALLCTGVCIYLPK